MNAPAARAVALAAGVLLLIGCDSADGLQPRQDASYGPFSPVVVPDTTPGMMPRATPEVIIDPAPTVTPTRPVVEVPHPRVEVEQKAIPVRGRIKGVATWYCKPGRSRCTRGFPADGAYAAAGPELRRALGRWRGRTVYVNGVPVELIDWCACGGDHVIDVYYSTWVTIPNQSRVTIRW